MDLRRLRAGEWIAAVSGATLVVSLFLPWYSAAGEDATAWQVLSVVDVMLFVLGVLGVVLLVVTAAQRSAAVGIASDAMLTLVAAVVFLVALVRVLNLPEVVDAAGGGREPFAWIALLATFGVLAGAVVAMRDERLSKPGRPTDPAGAPVDAPAAIETLPAPPRDTSRA